MLSSSWLSLRYVFCNLPQNHRRPSTTTTNGEMFSLPRGSGWFNGDGGYDTASVGRSPKRRPIRGRVAGDSNPKPALS